MRSIIQIEKECYITGAKVGLHEHHIFAGKNRANSEKYGLKIWLIPELHNMTQNGVHCNKDLRDLIHRAGQLAFERVHGSREEFVTIFGQNYLED